MDIDPHYVLSLISNLRVEHVPDDSGAISIPDEFLREMNEKHYQGQNTILMMVVEFGKREDLEFLLKIKGLDVNRRNEKDDTAADISWNLKSYDMLLILLQNDSIFPKKFSVDEVDTEDAVKDELKLLVKERERLHEWIKDGELEAIKNYTKNHKPSLYYATDNVSALSRAFQYENKDIRSHFSEIMPKSSIVEMAEENVLYSEIMEKPHLRKLVFVTRFSDEHSKEEFEAILTMYHMLEKHREISCLFKAIQNEDFEIIFAMKTESLTRDVERITIDVNAYMETNGRLFIAGKGINTTEGKQKVYRVFAHQFCHLVMQFVYKNNFNPYLPHDEKRISAFSVICKNIHKEHEDVDEIFQIIYKMYDKSQWHVELIVRIPELMALYGEDWIGLQRFGEKISELYKYYEEHIVKDCEEFSDSKFYSPELKNLKNISKDHLVIPNADICFPLFAKSENYEKYLIPWEARGYEFSILPTSHPELGALQILHELNKLHADRRYLAFKLEYYNSGYGRIIRDAFDSPAFEKLILVMPDTMVNCEPERIYDDIHYGSTNEKEVIVVVSSELCDKFPEWKVEKKLRFNWNDFSHEFKKKVLEKPVVCQGVTTSVKEAIKSVELTPDKLKNVMSDKEMCIGEALSPLGHEKDTYIERTFVRFVYKEDNFQAEQMPSHYLFMTGVSELTGVMKKRSQTISNYDDHIEMGKFIFLPKHENNNSEFFKNFCSRIEKECKQVFWIHFWNGKYLLREPLERSEDFENPFDEETFDEDQILKETEGMREVLVADDPGTGKSKSIPSLMGKMRIKYPGNLIFPVNFDSQSLLSLLEHIQRIRNMNTTLGKKTLQAITGVPRRVVVFCDGFDEMSVELQDKAMRTLQLLRQERQIQIWIFSRKHERLTLEEEMNTVSFSVMQFPFDDQRKYLTKLWLRRLILLNIDQKDLEKKFQEILKDLDNN